MDKVGNRILRNPAYMHCNKCRYLRYPLTASKIVTIAAAADMTAKTTLKNAFHHQARYSLNDCSPASVKRTLTRPLPPHQYWPGFSTG